MRRRTGLIKIDALEEYKQEYRWVAINKGIPLYNRFIKAECIEDAAAVLRTKKRPQAKRVRTPKYKIERIKELLKGPLEQKEIAVLLDLSVATVCLVNTRRHWSYDGSETKPIRQTKSVGPRQKG